MSVDQLDLERTGAYLESHLDGFRGLCKAEKFSDGQSNPTFLLSANSGQYVLRRQPPGHANPTAESAEPDHQNAQPKPRPSRSRSIDT